MPQRRGPPDAISPGRGPLPSSTWTFLTHHAHVLICIAVDPAARVRDLAYRVGITERAVQHIVADLIEAGYLKRFRSGRRNHYEVNPDLPLRHPLHKHLRISTLLDLPPGPIAHPPAPTRR